VAETGHPCQNAAVYTKLLKTAGPEQSNSLRRPGWLHTGGRPWGYCGSFLGLPSTIAILPVSFPSTFLWRAGLSSSLARPVVLWCLTVPRDRACCAVSSVLPPFPESRANGLRIRCDREKGEDTLQRKMGMVQRWLAPTTLLVLALLRASSADTLPAPLIIPPSQYL
jgi:hypothetical protein